jgi:hypothetical protein
VGIVVGGVDGCRVRLSHNIATSQSTCIWTAPHSMPHDSLLQVRFGEWPVVVGVPVQTLHVVRRLHRQIHVVIQIVKGWFINELFDAAQLPLFIRMIRSRFHSQRSSSDATKPGRSQRS